MKKQQDDRMDFKNKTYILFDLDGTITESGEGIIKGIKHSMKKMGMEDLCRDESLLKKFIGPPLQWSYSNLFHLNEKESKKAIGFFREYYETQGSLYENRLYEGMIELLESLVKQRKKLILATSKPNITAFSVIKYFDIEKYFYFLGTADLEKNRMEKAEVLAFILENCEEINKENSVMIGDRIYDVEAAKSFGLDCIAVSYGYANEGELEAAEPTFIVDTVDELKTILLA